MGMVARLRFSAEAGLLTQGTVRRGFNKLKDEILWREPEARVFIEEYKSGFLLKTFTFRAENLGEEVALETKEAFELMQASSIE